ncbi:MAG TPA: peptidoglycan editing factor PgeF [Anaerolineaceae bacterium]
MKAIGFNDLLYYTHEMFSSCGVIHGFFTRKGGVSPSPWASLNTASTVGDTRENIIENRRRIFQSVSLPVESIFDVWQVHGTDVVCTDTPRTLDTPHQQADAILTNRPGITLFMRFADCVPLLFFDPVKRVIGIAHAGWKGTVNKIGLSVVDTMKKVYHSQPQNIHVLIGPSIGPDHYIVGDDVVSIVRSKFSSDINQVIQVINGQYSFNLWKANRIYLEEAGVGEIINTNICTACDIDLWYSHRAEKGHTGRFAAILALG